MTARRRALRLPSQLELRLQRLERKVDRILDELDVEIDDAADSLGVVHGNPSSAREYAAWIRQQLDLDEGGE